MAVRSDRLLETRILWLTGPRVAVHSVVPLQTGLLKSFRVPADAQGPEGAWELALRL